MKRIGVLGGTFNPIHNGHLAIAEVVCEKMDLDTVLFVPSCLPPHKSGKNVLPAKHRLNMVTLAVKNYPHFEPSAIEIERKGRSYTVDTLMTLKKKYPDDTKFFFILGEDSLLTLSKWRRIENLLDLVTFVAVRRNKVISEEVETFLQANPNQNLSEEISDRIKRIRIISMPVLDISSNEIRRRILLNKEVQFYIPAEVDYYLKKHKLFKKD